MKLNILEFLLILSIGVIASTQNASALITLFKADHKNNGYNPIKVFYDESRWVDPNDSNQRLNKPSSENLIIPKGLVKYYDSSHCFSKIKSPKSKLPWILLLSAETTSVCNISQKIQIAQNAGYVGLMLYNNDLSTSGNSLDMDSQIPMHRIPIFFINNNDGQFLNDIFINQDHEVVYFIRLEKIIPWTSWVFGLYLNSPVHKILSFTCDVIFAFIIVIFELVLYWLTIAYTIIDKVGVILFLLICLPFIVLIYAAFAAETRLKHPFFGYHDFDKDHASEPEPEDDEPNMGSRRQRHRSGSEEKSEAIKKCYRLLTIPLTASFEEARAAYLKLSKRYHPDKSGDLTAGMADLYAERMKELTAAWRELKNHFQSSKTS